MADDNATAGVAVDDLLRDIESISVNLSTITELAIRTYDDHGGDLSHAIQLIAEMTQDRVHAVAGKIRHGGAEVSSC